MLSANPRTGDQRVSGFIPFYKRESEQEAIRGSVDLSQGVLSLNPKGAVDKRTFYALRLLLSWLRSGEERRV